MKSEKARELLERYEYSKESAIKAVEIAEQELCEKYAADIHKLVERWETADRKIDDEYLDDLREARAEIATLRTALDETKERLRISEKVIAQKNATPRSAEPDHAGMTLNEYQSRAMETCLPSSDNDCYMLFGLVEEVGELCGKVSKALRKVQIVVDADNIKASSERKAELYESIKSELSDCQWFIVGVARRFGWTLEEVAQYNLDKLAARKDADTIVTHTDH